VPIDPEVLTDPALDPSISTSYRMRVVYQEQTNEIHIVQTPAGGWLVQVCVQHPRADVVPLRHVGYVLLGRSDRTRKFWALESVSGTDTLRDEKLYSHDAAAYNSEPARRGKSTPPWYRLDHEAGMVAALARVAGDEAPSDIANVNVLTLNYYVDNVETIVATVTFSGAELAALFSTTARWCASRSCRRCRSCGPSSS